MRRARLFFGLLLVLLVVAALWWSSRPPTVLPGSAVVIRLQGDYSDAPLSPLRARLFGGGGASLPALLGELSKLELDDRVDTVIVRIRNLSLGWGRVEEIRDALVRLGRKGKKTVAYLELEGFGNAGYTIATGARRIVAAPGHRNPLVGLAAEYLFLGGLFEKLGVEVEYERIGRFKSAVETFTNQTMSEANREMSASLLDSIEDRFRALIAEGRGLSPERVAAVFAEAPTGGAHMQRLGLIDEILPWEALLEPWDEDHRIPLERYAGVPLEELGFEPEATFALVHGAGPVLVGEGRFSSRGEPVLASDTVAEALHDAAADPEVKAILFRIDSPGGSALASDIVWQAVRAAQAKGKPVVASFSDVAASGGYYVASGADRIVAQPTTYTGSIGVFVLKPVLGGLLEKLGIGVETMTRGPHADLLLATRSIDPSTREVLRDDIRSVYQLFLERVAEGRGLEVEAVDAIARGRVWTGAQAAERGLVDVLGGLRTAAVEARRLVGLDEEAPVVLVEYPKPRPLAEELAELLQGGVSARFAPELALPSTLATWVGFLRQLPEGAPLLVPAGWPVIH